VRPLTIVSPTACIGLGPTDRDAFNEALKLGPDLIGADMGSTDPGPYYLGAGAPHVSRIAARRDLDMILEAAVTRGIPCIIGTAGGNGARPHLDWTVRLIHEIAEEKNLTFDMTLVSADLPLHLLLDHARAGTLEGLDGAPPPQEEWIEQSTYAVAQMGVEQLIAALRHGPKVVLAGRCCDDAIFAALPIMEGYEKGLALHMGKILECAGVAAAPSFGFTTMVAQMDGDAFTVFPTDPRRRATVASVSAHSLYERRNPLGEPGPGGVTDMSHAVFEQVDKRAVKVSGSHWVPGPYKLKVEAARPVGYRSIAIAGVRGQVVLANLDTIIKEAEATLLQEVKRIPRSAYRIGYHRFGQDAVMKSTEPHPVPGHELGLVIDVVAEDQELASAIADLALMTVFSFGSPTVDLKSSSGNLAPMYSPWTIPMGPAFEFTLYHLFPVADPLAPFRFETVRVG
jgi:hypothetical protein